MTPDLPSWSFLERTAKLASGPLPLLESVSFQSNSQELLDIVDSAYRGLPPHRLSAVVPRLRIGLRLISSNPRHRRSEPEPLQMLSGAGFVGGATDASTFVVVDAAARGALINVSADMLRFPYHTRYELIEFAVFTLATRKCTGLIQIARCLRRQRSARFRVDGRQQIRQVDRVSLQCLYGFDFVSEDSTFVVPGSMLCTGVANFVHVRSDSLRWVNSAVDAAAIRNSPVISRRSGVRKFEVDLRRRNFHLAPAPLELAAVIFLSAKSAGGRALLTPLSKAQTLRRLAVGSRTRQVNPAGPSSAGRSRNSALSNCAAVVIRWKR